MAVRATFRDNFKYCPHKHEASFFTDGKIYHYTKEGKRVVCQEFSDELAKTNDSVATIVVENQSSISRLTSDAGCVRLLPREQTWKEKALVVLCEFANGRCGCSTLSKPQYCSKVEEVYERVIEYTLKD